MKDDGYIQVGFTALRDPRTGEYLPAVPLFVKAEDDAKEAEEHLQQDIGKLFADRMRKYKASCASAEVST